MLFSRSECVFCQCISMFTKNHSLLLRCWLNFFAINVLLLLFFFFFFILLSLVSSVCSTEPTKASHLSLPLFPLCYYRIFCLIPCWHLMFTTLIDPCQVLFSFSCLGLHNTDFVVWLLNESPLIGLRLFNSWLLHFFAASQVVIGEVKSLIVS